jgi:hypothetical protein
MDSDLKQRDPAGSIPREDTEPTFTWSIKRVPLVPGYWCVCVGPLREEWGDYAGKIFLAQSNITFSGGIGG